MKLIIPDYTGHTVLDTAVGDDVDAKWSQLQAQGYAFFLRDEKLPRTTRPSTLAETDEVLALAPLQGG